MAKLTLDLNQFRAAGVYTVEFDASESITVSTQTIRLVVGFSRRGPFNAPVFLRDVKSARQIFGEVDTILEKRGSFFHRSIETCLQTGPVYALNLLALDNTPTGDKIEYRPFSTSITQDNANVSRELIASFYNKERFWFPDTSYFQAIVDLNPITRDMLFSFTNFSQRPLSILIRKARNIKGFDITAREFYGSGNVPDFIKEFDYISDYFLDVIVVEGDWTNYETLSIDPLYSRFFDANGIKTEMIEYFITDDTVTLVANMTGCIIPDFTDRNGVNHFIENIVNNTVGTTGLFCVVNRAMFDDYENSDWKLDLIGHSLIGSTKSSMNFLSYVGPITDELFFSSHYSIIDETETTNFAEPDFNEVNGKQQNVFVKSLPYTNNSSPFFNTLVIPRPKMLAPGQQFTVSDYTKLATVLNSNSLIKAYGSRVMEAGDADPDTGEGGTFPGAILNKNGYLKVDSVTSTGNALELVLSNPTKNEEWSGIWDGITIKDIDPTEQKLTMVFPDNTFALDGPTMRPPQFISQFDMIYVKGYNRYMVVKDGEAASTVTMVPNLAYPSMIPDPAWKPTVLNGTWDSITFPGGEGQVWDETPGTENEYEFLPNPVAQGEIVDPSVPAMIPDPSVSYTDYRVEFYKTLEELMADVPTTDIHLNWFKYWLNGEIGIPASPIVGGIAQPNTLENRQVTYCNGEAAMNYMPNLEEGMQFIFKSSYIEDVWQNAIGEKFSIDVYPGNKLFDEIVNRSIIDGDYAFANEQLTDLRYFSFAPAIGLYGLPVQRIRQWANPELNTPIDTFADLIKMDTGSWIRAGIQTDHLVDEWLDIAEEHGLIVDRDGDPLQAPTYIAIQSAAAKIQQNVPVIDGTLNASKTIFRVNAANALDIEVGHYLAVDINVAGGETRLTKVINKIKRANATTGFTEFEIQVNEPVEIYTDEAGVSFVNRMLPIPQIAHHLQFTALNGFTITTYHMPGGRDQLWKIYGVIEDTNLGATLVDKELISFRYIVDTFAGGLEPMMGPKAILSRLAKRRLKCMALLNAPSISEFIQSTDPRFTDEPRPDLGEPKPLLRTEYISTGGNLSLGPSFRFSLPDDENGARFCGVFTPFLKIYEQNKNKMIPPAADVSNNFVRKFINGQPYVITAGPRRGILSNPKLTGLEYEYLLTDREWIEPMGLNPIITTKKTGPMIYGNQTAYQRTLTAFNNLHVRDLLITIEETVEDILSNYIFEFNDASTRLEIRTIVDGYLQTVRNAGGIYDFMVIMDETNNTPEVIDQNVGIIDIGIEPARGLQKVINRVTVLKTGAISSGGFTVA